MLPNEMAGYTGGLLHSLCIRLRYRSISSITRTQPRLHKHSPRACSAFLNACGALRAAGYFYRRPCSRARGPRVLIIYFVRFYDSPLLERIPARATVCRRVQICADVSRSQRSRSQLSGTFRPVAPTPSPYVFFFLPRARAGYFVAPTPPPRALCVGNNGVTCRITCESIPRSSCVTGVVLTN